MTKQDVSLACVGVGGSCKEDFVRGNLGAIGHAGVGGLTSSMRRGVVAGVGNGGKNESDQNFVGIGGLQSSGKIGVSSFHTLTCLG